MKKKPDYDKIGAEKTKEDLLLHLDQQSQVLRSLAVTKAFKDIDRADFVHPDYSIEAYEDYALPIGHEQTISQPTTVAFMLELLELREGDSVLNVGSGSGWTTALVASIVGKEGEVLGLEIVPELVAQGQANLEKYELPQARIELADQKLLTKGKQMYDRILVNADPEELPRELLAKLKKYGVMVVPIQGAIYKIKKLADDEIQELRFPGFNFVPLQ